MLALANHNPNPNIFFVTPYSRLVDGLSLKAFIAVAASAKLHTAARTLRFAGIERSYEGPRSLQPIHTKKDST